MVATKFSKDQIVQLPEELGAAIKGQKVNQTSPPIKPIEIMDDAEWAQWVKWAKYKRHEYARLVEQKQANSYSIKDFLGLDRLPQFPYARHPLSYLGPAEDLSDRRKHQPVTGRIWGISTEHSTPGYLVVAISGFTALLPFSAIPTKYTHLRRLEHIKPMEVAAKNAEIDQSKEYTFFVTEAGIRD